MVPIGTTVEDIQKLLAYLGKQIGWVEPAKIEKALGSSDDRKIGAMVEFGLIIRDGGNLRIAPRGQQFNSDQRAALREVLSSLDLYRATLEWVHYGKRAEATTSEIGQYWEASHKDTLGGVSGATLGSGAVTFGRIVAGAGLGTFVVGRSGKETRVTFDLAEVGGLSNGGTLAQEPEAEAGVRTSPDVPAGSVPVDAAVTAPTPATVQTLPVPAPTASVATSPSVHVNVEIHIAADATADTVREIAHGRDIAVVIEDHWPMAQSHGLDGVHLTSGARRVRDARRDLGKDAIVGAFCGASRHEGMNAGEAGADYVSFGPLGPTALGPGTTVDLELLQWWSEVIEVPVVAEGALDAALIRTLWPVADFIALGPEIWQAPDPAEALSALWPV